jgi:hypothetical protein
MTVLENLKARHFDTRLHTAWVDEEEGVATFPLWNLSSQLVGYQQYRPSGDKKKFNHPKEGRYFTWRKGLVVGVWGLESWSFSQTLFVTEGVFDAVRLTTRGYSAVATLSNDVDSSLARWFWTLRKVRRVVVLCDNDSAGLKLAKVGVTFHVMQGGKDLGEASDEYVSNLLKEYE